MGYFFPAGLSLQSLQCCGWQPQPQLTPLQNACAAATAPAGVGLTSQTGCETAVHTPPLRTVVASSSEQVCPRLERRVAGRQAVHGLQEMRHLWQNFYPPVRQEGLQKDPTAAGCEAGKRTGTGTSDHCRHPFGCAIICCPSPRRGQAKDKGRVRRKRSCRQWSDSSYCTT